MKQGVDYVGIFVSGICHDGQGNILYRRRGSGARDEQGKWDPGVGGALDVGETLEECLVRELTEEIGTHPLHYEFLGTMEKFRELGGQNTHWLGFFYKCLIDPTKVVKDSKDECDKMVWAPFHNHQSPMMTSFSETYEKFKHHFD